MATEWKGKSRGTVLGYKIFIFLLKNIGIRAAYFLLYFVAFYYCLFAWKSNRAMYRYLHKRQHYGWLKSFLKIYSNYYVFGQTIIDKVAISSGLRNRFTYEFDGIENIRTLLEKNQGGILISAHVGNFEIADHFFDELSADSRIHLVTTDAEHEDIKNYLESVTSRSNIQFIIINEDLSHIYDINTALSNGHLVCFTGDRYFEGQKVLSQNFMGKDALFPAGPFLLASRLAVPVLFVYVMKEPNLHYHLYARSASAPQRNAPLLLKNYTESVEWILMKYPLQWFNYFDFWNEKKTG